MEQIELIVDEKTYPKNLEILKENGMNHNDWEIKHVYYLELEHGLLGFFPAIITDQKRVVITADKKLLKKIWKTLSPRQSKINKELAYVHKKDPICYSAKHWMGDEHAGVNKLLIEEEYNTLVAEKEQPIEWAPGLVGNDMTKQEFIKTLELALVE